jgi:transcriptional regulator GlxA family with amidase domain
MHYCRELRVAAVRQELLHPNAQTSVTDTALKWGFNHLGRFSSYYAQRFGQLPSETLSVARASYPATFSAAV